MERVSFGKPTFEESWTQVRQNGTQIRGVLTPHKPRKAWSYA
jgi:hypothetical protein